jgi:hypothetical protein
MGTVVWVLGGLVIGVVIMRVGIGMLRSLGTPMPGPPPAGEMRRVNLRYRCSLCGTEVRMTSAVDELPEPPRHCMEDMDLQAPKE